MLLSKLFPIFFFAACQSDEIVEYTDDNYKEIDKNDVTLMCFYSPDCDYCSQFLPVFEEARNILILNDPPFHLIKMNCVDSGKVTCGKENVRAFPTLKAYRRGKFVEQYTRERKLEDITQYMKYNYGYKSKELSSPDDLDEFLNSRKVMLLGFFEKYTGLQKAFLKASALLSHKLDFGHVTSTDVMQTYGFYNDIILRRPDCYHNKIEEKNVTYAGSGDVEELLDFIQHNYHGIVGHRQSDCVDEFKPPSIVAYIVVDYINSPKLTNYWRNRILNVAKDFAGNIRFAISCKNEFEKELSDLGLNADEYQLPIVFGTNSDGVKFLMEVPFSVDAFRGFVQQFVEGSLKPYVKSEPIPEENDDPVTIIVGKTFQEVIQGSTDILVQFYTSWCLECLEFSAAYEDLAVELSDEDVIIAKMDVGANDYPSLLSITRYPTFYMFRKRSTMNPIRYNGTLEIPGLITFITRHSTNELKRYNRNGQPRVKYEL